MIAGDSPMNRRSSGEVPVARQYQPTNSFGSISIRVSPSRTARFPFVHRKTESRPSRERCSTVGFIYLYFLSAALLTAPAATLGDEFAGIFEGGRAWGRLLNLQRGSPIGLLFFVWRPRCPNLHHSHVALQTSATCQNVRFTKHVSRQRSWWLQVQVARVPGHEAQPFPASVIGSEGLSALTSYKYLLRPDTTVTGD